MFLAFHEILFIQFVRNNTYNVDVNYLLAYLLTIYLLFINLITNMGEKSMDA